MTNHRVFTYKDVEEAKEWVGKPGYFSNTLWDLEFRSSLYTELTIVHKQDSHPFTVVDGGAFQFFSPDEEPEPQYIPFTAQDRLDVHLRAVRRITWAEGLFGTVIGWDGVAFVIGEDLVSPEAFLKYWTFMDGSPCGKVVKS